MAGSSTRRLEDQRYPPAHPPIAIEQLHDLTHVSNLLKQIVHTVSGDWPPFLLSAIALGLGIGPGWRFFWTLELADYDPTIAVLTATLVALIWTADYTFHAVRDGRRREEREEQRRQGARQSILIGVTAELESQYVWLRSVAVYLCKVPALRLERPLMAEALRNTDLLDPQEVAIVSGVSMHLQVAESELTNLLDAISQKHPQWREMSIKDIEAAEPLTVSRIRVAVEGVQSSIKTVAPVLDPNNVVGTDWKKLDALPG